MKNTNKVVRSAEDSRKWSKIALLPKKAKMCRRASKANPAKQKGGKQGGHQIHTQRIDNRKQRKNRERIGCITFHQNGRAEATVRQEVKRSVLGNEGTLRTSLKGNTFWTFHNNTGDEGKNHILERKFYNAFWVEVRVFRQMGH